MKKFFYLSVFLCLAFNFITVKAQTTHATISGTVTDQQNNALVGATVQVRNESTGFNTGTQTNTQGDFLLKELPLGGPYTVVVSYVGYAEQRQTGFVLHQGDAIRVRTNLQESNQSL